MTADPLIIELASFLSERFPTIGTPQTITDTPEANRSHSYLLEDKEKYLSFTASIERRNGIETLILRWPSPHYLGPQEASAVIDALATLSGEYGASIKVLGIKGADEKAFWTSHHYVPNGHGWIPNPDL